MIRFRSTVPAERDRIAAFLQEIFKLAPGSPLLHPATLDWKYFGPHPLWEGDSRSYVLEQDGAYAGHGCASPVLFRQGDNSVRSFQMVDWASSGEVPGAGAFLYRSLLPKTDVLLAVGGSEDAQRILPHFRIFRQVESTFIYGLPLRPIRQIVRSQKNWKTPARLIRNWLWSRRRTNVAGGWRSELVREPLPDWPFDSWLEPLMASGIVPLRRSMEWLRYLVRCPSAPLSIFSIEHDGSCRGYAAVSFVLNQARIVDLLISSHSELDWAHALSALTERIADMEAADEVFTRTSAPLFAKALLDVGFVQRGESVVYLADPSRKIRDTRLEINCLVGDQMYLPTPEMPYVT